MSFRQSTLQAILEEVRDVNKRVQSVEKNVYEIKNGMAAGSSRPDAPPPIARPVRAVQYNRTISVSNYLREKIKEHNDFCDDCKYLEFLSVDEVTNKQQNSNAIMCIEQLLRSKLAEQYGKMTWEKAESNRETAKKAGSVILAASKMKDLAVFAQAQVQWAIRMLAAAKMKSKSRTDAPKPGDVAEGNKSGENGPLENDGDMSGALNRTYGNYSSVIRNENNAANGSETLDDITPASLKASNAGYTVLHRSANRVLISGRKRPRAPQPRAPTTKRSHRKNSKGNKRQVQRRDDRIPSSSDEDKL